MAEQEKFLKEVVRTLQRVRCIYVMSIDGSQISLIFQYNKNVRTLSKSGCIFLFSV